MTSYRSIVELLGPSVIPTSDTRIFAEKAMFEFEPLTFRPILSQRAQQFISDNGLGNFSIRFDEDVGWLFVEAPDEHAATLFRLAF